MNVVTLVGEVTDRPFKPGNGSRTVVKIKTKGAGGNPDHFEFDAFGQPGEFGARLYVGDVIAITGRLEDRTFTEDGERVTELRIVAQFIELVTRAGDRAHRDRSASHNAAPSHDSDHDDSDHDDRASHPDGSAEAPVGAHPDDESDSR